MAKGCQIFLDTVYQNGGKYTKLPLHYLMALKYFPNSCTIMQMTIKCINIFSYKALKNLPKFGCFGLKTGNPAMADKDGHLGNLNLFCGKSTLHSKPGFNPSDFDRFATGLPDGVFSNQKSRFG
jgi:hypothetical protein